MFKVKSASNRKPLRSEVLPWQGTVGKNAKLD